jgi:hypothetical protein
VKDGEAARPSTVDEPAAARVAAPEHGGAGPIPAQRAPSDQPEGASGFALLMVALVVAGTAGWLFLAWLVLHAPLIDAVGEAAGSLALGLVIISLVGSLRRSRR